MPWPTYQLAPSPALTEGDCVLSRSRAAGRSQPDSSATPASGWPYVSAANAATAAPCEKPAMAICRWVSPSRRTSVSIAAWTRATDDA